MIDTTSLDIQHGKGSVIDIAQMFPISGARTLDLSRHGRFVDGIVKQQPHQKSIDLSTDAIIRIKRFSTLDMLDVGIPEIMNPAHRKYRIGVLTPRPRKINLVPPLTIPYGALDVRLENEIVSPRTYPDLFARKLPYGLLVRRLAKGSRRLYKRHQRRVYKTLAGIAIFSVPVLSYVGYSLDHGYKTIESLTHTTDLNEIRDMIHRARGDFERSNFLFAPFAWIPVDRIDSVDRIIRGGLALTRGMDMIAQSLPDAQLLSGSIIKKETQDPLSYRAASRDIFFTESIGIENPSDWIKEHIDILEKAKNEFTTAGEEYSNINVTGERTMKIQKIGKTIARVSAIMDWSLQNQTHLLNMLGHTNPQRYIVFNQNRDEIRANGGFPGSILSFTFYKGNILDYHADDVYYYDWNLYPYKEIPPPGIALLTDNYGLRDVNYYPDFHDTLEKANGFIERSGDASVTTGIAIHQGIVEDILAKVGPVTVSGVTIPFDEKNFSLLMSTLVENKYAKEHTPKDILFQFGNALLAKLIEKNNFFEVIDSLDASLKNGEILFASRDNEIDNFLSAYQHKLPWQQNMPNWIYPVWTSVSGNKSDRYISRSYEAKTQKINDCLYENTITLGLKHTFAKKDNEELQSYFQTFAITDKEEQAKLSFIQGNGKNRSYVRVFVPQGASLVGAGSDISVVNNENATVFALVMETPVGSTSTKTWKYQIQVPNCSQYDNKIEWIRQPGLRELMIK